MTDRERIPHRTEILAREMTAVMQKREHELSIIGECPGYILVNPFGRWAELNSSLVIGYYVGLCSLVRGDAIVVLPVGTF